MSPLRWALSGHRERHDPQPTADLNQFTQHVGADGKSTGALFDLSPAISEKPNPLMRLLTIADASTIAGARIDE
jgi:hypothetical protein